MAEDQEPYNRLLNAMKRQEVEDKIFIDKVVEAFTDLNLHNSIYAEFLLELASLLCQHSLCTVVDPAGEMELDRDRGMSLNIGPAIRALSKYASPLREGGEQYRELMVAIVSIVREKERRILNEL